MNSVDHNCIFFDLAHIRILYNTINNYMNLPSENGYFGGWGQVQIVFGSTLLVQQLLFSLFPSILTFDFDLIWGLFCLFGAKNRLFRGLGSGSNCFWVYSYSATTFIFFLFPSILTLDFDLMFRV